MASTKTLQTRGQNPRIKASAKPSLAHTYLADTQTLRAKINGDRVQNDILGIGRIGATYWTRTPDGTRISQRAGANKHYYLRDGVNSNVALTDPAGTITRAYTYDPFGNTRLTTGSTANPWQYLGEHSELGGSLYKIGARFYDPALGRWTQSDPVDQLADIREGNRYAYAAADPINVFDPAGTDIFSDAYNAGKKAVDEVKGPARRLIAANGAACYIRKSGSDGDTNSIQDDVVDGVNCVNPVSGFTGELGGSDDG